jgi:hypothetical protein
MVFWLSGCVCCVMFYYFMRSCVRSQLMYFFSSNNNYVIQKYTLSPEGMFANTRFSREQCWQTLLFVLKENVCKYLTQTAPIVRQAPSDPAHSRRLLTTPDRHCSLSHSTHVVGTVKIIQAWALSLLCVDNSRPGIIFFCCVWVGFSSSACRQWISQSI